MTQDVADDAPSAHAEIDSGEIRFAGRCTVAEAPETHRELLRALNGAEDLVIDLRGVERADLAFIQLLLSLRKSAVAMGKAVRLASQPTDGMLEALLQGGFVSLGADGKPVSNDPFWLCAE